MTVEVKQDVIEDIVGGNLPDETLSEKINDVHISDLRLIVSLIQTYIDASDEVNEWIEKYLISNLNSITTKFYSA